MEKYRTFPRRIAAMIIDSLILMPLSWGASVFAVIGGSSPAAVAVSSAMVGAISVFYSILLHNYYGQTLGKMAVKVKVLNESENPINFAQAVLRSFPQLILAMFAVSFSTGVQSPDDLVGVVNSLLYGSFGIFIILDIIVCVLNEKSRALHDLIAGTVVVRTDI